jgi:competence protein ComFC
MIASAANAVVRVFLAPTCAACGGLLDSPLASPVCPGCWRAVPALTPPCCVRCGDALASSRTAGPWCARCRHRAPVFTLARSAGLYDGSLRQIIHAFKYEGRRVLAEPLAALMREAGESVLAGADAVVPVPLHPWRALQRGFNQADDLARALGPPVWRVLARTRHGPPQAGLPAARRHANVRAAYALSGPWPLPVRGGVWLDALAARRLRNRVVVLVDDVMTTGATLEACGRVLAGAGVRSVRALTVARAVAPRPASPPATRRPATARR